MRRDLWPEHEAKNYVIKAILRDHLDINWMKFLFGKLTDTVDLKIVLTEKDSSLYEWISLLWVWICKKHLSYHWRIEEAKTSLLAALKQNSLLTPQIETSVMRSTIKQVDHTNLILKSHLNAYDDSVAKSWKNISHNWQTNLLRERKKLDRKYQIGIVFLFCKEPLAAKAVVAEPLLPFSLGDPSWPSNLNL